MKYIILLFLTALQTFANDPSLKAQVNENGNTKYLERTRILTDLDADGNEDMLLTIVPNDGGKMGDMWAVYLSRKGNYVKAGEICAHSMSISIEPDQAMLHKSLATRRYARIWVYLRGSGRSGSLGYYSIGEKTIDPMESIEIYPEMEALN